MNIEQRKIFATSVEMIDIEDDIQLKQKLLILLLKHDENASQTD